MCLIFFIHSSVNGHLGSYFTAEKRSISSRHLFLSRRSCRLGCQTQGLVLCGSRGWSLLLAPSSAACGPGTDEAAPVLAGPGIAAVIANTPCHAFHGGLFIWSLRHLHQVSALRSQLYQLEKEASGVPCVPGC